MYLIENMRTGTISLGLATTLIPGVNQVDPETWAAWEKHPVIKDHLENEILIVRGAKDFTKLPERQALKLVLSTFDIKLLRTWQTDKRPAVRDAVKAQLAEMVKPIETEPPKA